MSRVGDRTWGLKVESGQERDSMAESIRKKWLTRLLTDEQVVGLFLSYLKETEVGSRKAAAEVTKKWMQKNDQEREEQQGNF